MRALIVDASRSEMGRVRRQLAAGIPDVEVSEYDADERGLPEPSFEWSVYDVVILAERLGVAGGALECLRAVSGRPGFPPCLVIAEAIDAYGTVALMRAGAAGVLLRADVDTASLVREVGGIARAQSGPLPEHTVIEPGARVAAGDEPAATPMRDEEYQFMRLIGQGGMSRVYLSKRVRDDMLIVVKTIASHLLENEEMRERFLAEAELAKSVESDHVVEIYDYGFGNNYGMIAMEFFPLGDLKRRIEGGVTEEQARDYFGRIVSALDAIGSAGIVHRDLKPGNLMFRADDGLALADFGIAKRLGASVLYTTVGRVLGTPVYLSPEQAKGLPADSRSDLYSAGVIFFEMLSGKRPFDAPTIESMMYQHVHGDIPRLPSAVAIYQPLVDRLLAKDPDDRFPDAAAVLRALETG